MDIKQESIPLIKTPYLGEVAKDYLRENIALSPLYGKRGLNAVEWEEQAKSKKLHVPRERLKAALIDQYKKSGIDLSAQGNEQVLSGIESLSNEQTFTITTGQQIHVFLGPVFVWYKILSLLAHCKELEAKLEGVKIIPVFWMATEDHDLEEIQEVNLYNENYTWETDQKGAVGRMKPTGLPQLADQILERIDPSDENVQFIRLCKKAYSTANTLADATRIIVHELFKDQGLLILDPDDRTLKETFMEVFRWEYETQGSNNLISGVNTQLIEMGYKPQIKGRNINLFVLEDGRRSRMDQKGKGHFTAIDGDLTFDIDPSNLSAEEFSPNALLRPLYQEFILPNLAYIAGGSELAYWLQLKPIFDHWNCPFPILLLRSHGIILHDKLYHKLTKKALLETYFLPVEEFRIELMKDRKEEMERIKAKMAKAEGHFHGVKEMLEKSAFQKHVSWKDFSELHKSIGDLNSLVYSTFNEYFEKHDDLKPALTQKRRFFDDEIQERKRSIINYLAELNHLKYWLTQETQLPLLTDYSQLNVFITK